MPKYPTIHTQSEHTYRDTFGNAHIQYHDFDNQDSLTFKDKYTTLLQQELQNLYWNFLFYTHILKLKAIPPYIQEEV